jgi:hypothetical protein
LKQRDELRDREGHEEQSHEHNPQAKKQTISTKHKHTNHNPLTTNGKHSKKNTKQHHSLRWQTPQGHEENRTRKEATNNTTTGREEMKKNRNTHKDTKKKEGTKNHTRQKNFFFNANKDDIDFVLGK